MISAQVKSPDHRSDTMAADPNTIPAHIVEAATRLAAEAPEFDDAVYAVAFTALGYTADELQSSARQRAA